VKAGVAAAAPQLEGQLGKVRMRVACSSVLKIKAVMSCRMIIFPDKTYFASSSCSYIHVVIESGKIKISIDNCRKVKGWHANLFVRPQIANLQILGLIPQYRKSANF
jgi:hypothetical protein